MPQKKCYPIRRDDYELYNEIGKGCSASVYRAKCIPLNDIVAIKIINLEKTNLDLETVSREAHTMLLIDHPNLLKSHCSFVNGEMLWVVMPYMSAGSCLQILQARYKEGFEEPVIATILREVLKALEYLHNDGHIHRDIKAGNVLINESGEVKLADFGVAANLFDSGDRQRVRKTFVGTPCWMAPEVMEHKNGYNLKADIWSFGITALELAYGHAPFYKWPPIKVFLMTIQSDPPSLNNNESNRKFSKSFGHMLSHCLLKNPSERPTPTKLLKHSFFHHKGRSKDYLARTILKGLPEIGGRVQSLNAMLSKDQDDKSMKEMTESQKIYKMAISRWDFNCEELKKHAQLIEDVECDNALANSAKQIASRSNSMDHTEVVDKSTNSEQGNNIAETFTTEINGRLRKKKSVSSCDSFDVNREESLNRSQISHDSTEHCHEVSKLGLEGNPKPKVQVEQKGRFKVTSENIDLEKCHVSTSQSNSHTLSKSLSLQHIHASSSGAVHSQHSAKSHNSGFGGAMPCLLHFLKDAINSREYILNTLKQQNLANGVDLSAPHSTKISDRSLIGLLEANRDKEKELMHLVNELMRNYTNDNEHHQHKHKSRNSQQTSRQEN